MTVATHIDTASVESMIATFANAVQCIPIMTGDKSEAEYNKASELIEYLVDRDKQSNSFFEPLTAKITEYENSAPEFEAFNRRLAEIPTGVAALRILMDQHSLKAADLIDELGSKSNVSNILNGRRALTLKHIKALASRFNVPADLFI